MQYSLQPDIVTKLLELFNYVDDLVCGGNDEDKAQRHYIFARDALRHASFNPRKFITNSHILRDRVKREEPHLSKDNADVTYADTTLFTEQLNQPDEHKVLGVRWNIQTDQLIFELSTITESTVTLLPTKRKVISLIDASTIHLGFYHRL